MMRLLISFILVISVSLAGCSSSRVVLLDIDKKQNSIVYTTKDATVVLEEPNTYIELSTFREKPSAIKKITPQEIQNRYGKLISFAPKPPEVFLLYFESGPVTLTETSTELLPEVEKTIKERIPCDVNIIGHADRVGSKDSNIKLSLERANFVKDWLLGRALHIEKIAVESYGEEDPLIPTPDGVSEPRNRRVEIMIR